MQTVEKQSLFKLLHKTSLLKKKAIKIGIGNILMTSRKDKEFVVYIVMGCQDDYNWLT